jgi:hypothetical protein
MNKNCENFTLSKPESDRPETLICPYCNHIVVTGIPHPDFSNQDLPVSADELDALSGNATQEHDN